MNPADEELMRMALPNDIAWIIDDALKHINMGLEKERKRIIVCMTEKIIECLAKKSYKPFKNW